MKERKKFRTIMVAVCFMAAAMNTYKIVDGDYSYLDVVLLVVFLLFAGVYIYLLRDKENKSES
jgi:Ca2+/Na+ antiporter